MPSGDQVLPFVLGLYGAAMMQVQAFEAILATLVTVVEAKPAAGPTTLERALGKAMKKNWHLLQVASASEMKRRLEGRIPADLWTDIETMIKWRDFLAHRYLRTRVFAHGGAKPRVEPWLVLELQELQLAYKELGDRVQRLMLDMVSKWPPRQPAPVGAVEALQQMARQLAAVQPRPFSRQSPAPPADDA